MRRVVTPRWAEYGAAVAGQAIVEVGVDHAGHPVLLTTDRADLPPSPTRFRDPGLVLRHPVPLPRRFRLVAFGPAGPRVVDLRAPTTWLTEVQPLPGGRWLLVPADAIADAQAPLLVAEADGGLAAPFRLGDPAVDLLGVVPTPDGHLWSHYGDHAAWQGRGLRCHAPDGRLVHGVDDLPGARAIGYNGFTYALTPSGPDAVHAYVLDRGFGMMALDPRGLRRSWARVPIEGATAFAISATHALFGPGYDLRRRLTLVDLAGEPGRWRTVEAPTGPIARYDGKLRAERLAPVDERGRPVGFVRTAARGDVLWLFAHDAVYMAAIAELARPEADHAPALGRDEPTGLEPTLGGG